MQRVHDGCRSSQEVKCSLKGLALEPRLELSQRQLVFGEVATHAWADQNLVLANQGALLPIRFNIPHSPYFHCIPNQGMLIQTLRLLCRYCCAACWVAAVLQSSNTLQCQMKLVPTAFSVLFCPCLKHKIVVATWLQYYLPMGRF